MSDLHRHLPTVAPFISLIPIIIAGASMKARRPLIEQLREAGATNPAHAIAVEPRSRLERNWLGRLESVGQIRNVGGRYYYDETVVADFRRAQLRQVPLIILIALVSIGIGFAIVLLTRTH